MLNRSASLAMSTSVLKALPGKLIKDTNLVFSTTQIVTLNATLMSDLFMSLLLSFKLEKFILDGTSTRFGLVDMGCYIEMTMGSSSIHECDIFKILLKY